MELKLTLVRHGETAHNKESVIQGHLDTPLAPNGVRQAKLLGLRLSGQNWKQVWASDLKRAWQTANFIIQENVSGLDDETLLAEPSPLVITDPRMRERNFGIVQGQPFTELKKMAESAGKNLAEFTPPEAETLEEIRMRAIDFFNALCLQVCKNNNTETDLQILLVSHGGWLRELLGYLAANSIMTDEESPIQRNQAVRITPNTGLSSFLIKLSEEGIPHEIQCTKLHDRSHLDDASTLINHSNGSHEVAL